MKKDIRTTQDRLQKAKDALIFALHSAERELPAIEQKRLGSLAGKIESMQSRIAKYAN